MAAVLQATSEDTRIYECCVLYPFPLNQKEEQEILKGVEEIFDEAGAKLVLKDAWGRRGLAYPVKGFREGNFVIYYYEIDPSKIKEIDQQLKILRGMLRHLIVKPPKNYQVVSYAGRLDEWKKEEKVKDDQKAMEKEEKLKKQVLDKAKRSSKRSEQKEVDTEKKAPAPKADIGKKLDELISEDGLGI